MTNEKKFERYERAKALIPQEEIDKEHVRGLLRRIEDSRLENNLACPHGYRCKDAFFGELLWETPNGYHLTHSEYNRMLQGRYENIFFNLCWIGIRPEEIELYQFQGESPMSDKPYRIGIPRETTSIDTSDLIASVARELSKKYQTKREVKGGSE